MATARYHKVKIGEHELNAETLMLGYGYDPSLSEGSVKPPVFLTSTFVFQTAEQGRDFFDYLAGRRAPPVEGQTGLVYSRFNHPNLEIVEDRLAIHEKAASGLVFASGMAAIVTLMLAYVRPGETVLHSRPIRPLRPSASKASALRTDSTSKKFARPPSAPVPMGASQ